jgi:hypothetical protein
MTRGMKIWGTVYLSIWGTVYMSICGTGELSICRTVYMGNWGANPLDKSPITHIVNSSIRQFVNSPFDTSSIRHSTLPVIKCFCRTVLRLRLRLRLRALTANSVTSCGFRVPGWELATRNPQPATGNWQPALSSLPHYQHLAPLLTPDILQMQDIKPRW